MVRSLNAVPLCAAALCVACAPARAPDLAPDAAQAASDAAPRQTPDAAAEIDTGLADAGTLDSQPADAGPPDAAPPIEPVYQTVQAAVARGDGKLFFFRGDAYIRYDIAANSADASYPRSIDRYWSGLWADDIDAAFAHDGSIYFFRGHEYLRYDIAADAAAPGFPKPIAGDWPGLWPDGIDAAAATGDGTALFFRDGAFVRFDLSTRAIDPRDPSRIRDAFPGVDGRRVDAATSPAPDLLHLFFGRDSVRFDLRTGVLSHRAIGCWWPGLWDRDDGTGHPGARLPPDVAAQIVDDPTPEEIAARIARVLASVADSETDVTDQSPRYVASIEAHLGIAGCRLLRRDDGGYRFRCATDTQAPLPLDIEPFTVDSIDWARAAYHVVQTSQGDFVADKKTPITVLASDDGLFRVVSVRGNPATGGIFAGSNIRLRLRAGGAEHDVSFFHLDSQVPAYVIDAAATGTPLPVGTVVGFIGYTGNLGIGAPPASDRPFEAGDRLPTAHSHIWFVGDQQSHATLAPWARKAIDFSGRYPNGGG